MVRFMGAGARVHNHGLLGCPLPSTSALSLFNSPSNKSPSPVYCTKEKKENPHTHCLENQTTSTQCSTCICSSPNTKETRVSWEHPWQNQHYRSRSKKCNHKFLHKIITFLVMRTSGWNWDVRYSQILMTDLEVQATPVSSPESYFSKIQCFH